MAMQPHFSFDALSAVIEQLDSEDCSVCRVEAAAEGDAEETLRATVDVAVPLCLDSGTHSTLEPATATTDGDDLAVSFRLPAVSDDRFADDLPDGLTAALCPADACLDDGDVVVTLDVVIESQAGDTSAGSATQPDGSERTSSTADDAATIEAAATTESTAERSGGDVRNHRATTVFGGVPAASTAIGAASRSGSAAADDGPAAASDAAADPTAGDDSAADDGSEADCDADDVTATLAAARDDSLPPYDDTAYLQRLYDVCETFAEMSERIEMDVSDETVRRYMIDAGVHTPTSYETTGSTRSAAASRPGAAEPTAEAANATEPNATTAGSAPTASADGETAAETSTEGRSPASASDDPAADRPVSDAEAESLPDEQLVADGIGLPDELTLQDVVDAVVDARTVHEVQRDLGLEHDRTRQLLRQLNVLDLVLRRVSDDPERSVSFDAVAARIRQCAPDAA